MGSLRKPDESGRHNRAFAIIKDIEPRANGACCTRESGHLHHFVGGM